MVMNVMGESTEDVVKHYFFQYSISSRREVCSSARGNGERGCYRCALSTSGNTCLVPLWRKLLPDLDDLKVFSNEEGIQNS
jgi:hypothetical protein